MKKSNVIGLTVGIVVTIVAVSLISWFAIRPVPTLIQGEVEATDIKISSKLAGRIEQMDVQEGERVKKGQLLMKFDLDGIKADGYDVTTPIVVTNADEFTIKTVAEGTVVPGAALLKLEAVK